MRMCACGHDVASHASVMRPPRCTEPGCVCGRFRPVLENALSREAQACRASEVRVGDTFISPDGPRVVTAVERPRPGQIKVVWRDSAAELTRGRRSVHSGERGDDGFRWK